MTPAQMLGLAALMTLILRVWQRPEVQSLLPVPARWDSWPLVAQLGLVFGANLVAGILTAMAGGIGWSSALSAALGVALASIGIHKATSDIGHAESLSAIADGKLPGPARRALDIVLPLHPMAVAQLDASKPKE